MGDRFEWVEIIEPSRHEHMFANLKTGQCLWDPPDGVPVKPTHENQWWELFDTNTGRYYYYNATSQETVWRKPKDGDIIPLSKLQMLKTRESSLRDSPGLNELKNENNFDNNNIESMKSESVRFNENKFLGHSEDKFHVGNKDKVMMRNPDNNAPLKNTNKQHLFTNEDRSFSQSAAGCNTASILNGKRASFPRTLTVGPTSDRPAIKDKPKSSSLRSKAPPKPPRMTVNVTDPRSNNIINISVEKSVESEESSHETQKENVIPSSSQMSVQKSPKMTHKSIEKPKGPPPPAPTASISSQDNPVNSTMRNSMNNALSLSGHNSTLASEQSGIYATVSTVISSKESTITSSTLNEVNDSLESTNISHYAVPRKIDNPPVTETPLSAEYALPVKSAPEPEQQPSSVQINKYDTPMSIITDTQLEQKIDSEKDTEKDTEKDIEKGAEKDAPDISKPDIPSDPVIIPPTPCDSNIGTSQNGKEPLFPDMKPALIPNDYAFINEIDVMNDRDTSVTSPSPEFPVNVIPVPPPPPKIIPRKQLPSMYDNVDPTSLQMFEYSSENEDLNETFNSGDDLISPRPGNMSGSSDEAFDPSESNLLGSESPDGNYYDRIDGMERRSCATLPSPRSSPRKLPKTPLEESIGGTPPAKRNPLVRMKSDPLVDVEKRAKISKTIESIQSTFRPISMLNLSNNIANITNKHKRSVLGSSDSDIPEQVPLSTHRTGILRRRMSIHSMLSWSKSCIKKPMVLTRDKSQRKEAVDVFKLILMCMGDKSTRKSHENICVDIVTKGWTTPQLRDEIYIQLCKQTTGNKKLHSLRQGWELITACLSIFPPSNKFHSYLEGYISRHLDNEEENIIQADVPQYAKYCYKQLERICQTGAKRGLKGPTVEEINAAIKRVFNPSMFGNTLEDVMEMQKDKFPDHRLPWILTTLTESVLLQNGLQTEGIFRVPGDIDDVNQLKLMIDNWQAPEHKSDPTVPASLLKLWFRDLYEPLIPQRFYDQCIHNCDNAEISLNIIQSLPPLNRLIFSYLIRLLQAFIIPENVAKSKMDENNLSMVWAPNCLRCPSDDPREIFENTRKEMTFLRNVLKVLDTSFLEGVV